MSEHNEISRRRVVAGAAWAAPVIIVASAAPAAATSGQQQPNVTTIVEPAVHSGTNLPVTVRFRNSGAQGTGLTTIDVFFTLRGEDVSGSVSDAAPVIDTVRSSAGWTFDSVRGTLLRRIFTFTNPVGIAGAPSATSPAENVLAFSVTVDPAGVEPLTTSTGNISVFFALVTNGDRPDNGNGAWI